MLKTGNLVMDLGNSHLVAGLFLEDMLVQSIRVDLQEIAWQAIFKQKLEALLVSYVPKAVLLGSVNSAFDEVVIQIVQALGFLVCKVNNSNLKTLKLDVLEPQTVGADLIANAYGALKNYSDHSLVIDIGTAVTISAIRKDRTFLGGIIYPGFNMSASALARDTDGLPYVKIIRPQNPLGKDTETHIQSGVFYGLVATLEYFIKTFKETVFSKEKVIVIATGGITSVVDLDTKAHDSENLDLGHALQAELQEVVDVFEPNLTLIGLNEILKEVTLEEGFFKTQQEILA